MKTFMAVFTGSADSPQQKAWAALSEPARNERIAKGMQAWTQWMVQHAPIIAETGGPLGKTKRTTAAGVADISNNLAAYVVIRAESHEAAARLFENHPHFAIFPGDGVEVMEVMPIPGQ